MYYILILIIVLQVYILYKYCKLEKEIKSIKEKITQVFMRYRG